jgi:hypothetical protein
MYRADHPGMPHDSVDMANSATSTLLEPRRLSLRLKSRCKYSAASLDKIRQPPSAPLRREHAPAPWFKPTLNPSRMCMTDRGRLTTGTIAGSSHAAAPATCGTCGLRWSNPPAARRHITNSTGNYMGTPCKSSSLAIWTFSFPLQPRNRSMFDDASRVNNHALFFSFPTASNSGRVPRFRNHVDWRASRIKRRTY